MALSSPTTLSSDSNGEVTASGTDHGLLSDELRQMFELVCYVIINGVFGVLGSLANGINIAVFVKQSLKESINISLVCLAVADMCSLLVLVWQSVGLNPLFATTDSSTSYLHYYSTAFLQAVFVSISWWITTFITFERCLCIAMPLKVKQVITPRRTICIIVIIFIVNFLGMSPFVISIRLQPIRLPSSNITVLAREYIDGGVYIESVGLIITVLSQFEAFITDVICTVVMVTLLNYRSKWRRVTANTSASAVTKEFLAARDKKVVRMVIAVSVIFITCLMPTCANLIFGLILAPDYSSTGIQQNLYYSVWACILTLQSLNSSVKCFVYYNMSSNFKMALNKLFCRLKRI